MVIDQIILALLPDFDDILLLSSHNGHWGALKLLRCAFERVVTLKYIAQNPSEVEAFIDFDSLDWKRILMGIENKTGLRMSETSQTNLDTAVAAARTRFRQEPCETCGLRKQTTWTPLSARDLAKRTGMEHMFFHAYESASKFIHPTFWGTHQITGGAGCGGYNRALLPDQPIKQTRFADVWPADDGRPDTAAENLAFICRPQEFIHERDTSFQPEQELLFGVRGDVFVRKIDVRFDVGEDLEHVVAQFVDALGKLSCELLVGGAQGQFGARMDQVGYSFGLREINAPIEKSAPGKLARFGCARAVVQ